MDDPDVKLARRARRGDRTALTSLYEKHRGPLFGFLLTRVYSSVNETLQPTSLLSGFG